MACGLSSPFDYRECVLLDQKTLGKFPAQQETVDAEERVSTEGFLLQCKTGAYGLLCEGTEGPVMDPR